jgi:hypothetical protein
MHQPLTGEHVDTERFNRRSFLQTSATIGAAATVSAPNILRARNLNEKLNIAVIGTGGRGLHDLHQFAGRISLPCVMSTRTI